MSDTPHVELNAQEAQDMQRIKELFDRALNALIASSQLSKEVEELRRSVGDLREQVERYRQSNAAMDETITAMRRERDQAVAEAREARAEANLYQARVRELEGQTQDLQRVNDELQRRLSNAIVDRDDAELRCQDWQTKFQSAYDKLAEIEDQIKEFFPDKPVPPPVTVSIPVLQEPTSEPHSLDYTPSMPLVEEKVG